MGERNKKRIIVDGLKGIIHGVKRDIHKHYGNLSFTGPQGMLVGILVHDGQMKISELSEKMNLSNSTVSGIVDRLEKQGTVERIRSEKDRRVVYINVTSEFKKFHVEKFKEVEKNMEDKLNVLSEEELNKVIEGLDILKKIIS